MAMSIQMVELPKVHARVIGLDVHQAKITACAIIEDAGGESHIEFKEFGGFKRDLRALSQWVSALNPQEVVMESTGIYWKSPYAELERVGIRAKVVNARHVKKVPGRKTDISDAHWLALLSKAGLLNGSFVPPERFRELRLISRARQGLVQTLATHKNRVHKLLADAGVRLSVVVSDLNGVSAKAMIKAIAEGQPTEQILACITTRLKASREEMTQALEGHLSAAHRFVLQQQLTLIELLEQQIKGTDQALIAALEPEELKLIERLQTIPGMDLIGSITLIIEIGTDMSVFGSADRLASWVGLCPGNNESAGKRKSGRTTKGNIYVRRILCECAHAARRTKSALGQRFTALLVRRGFKRAIIGLAHKILRIAFCMIQRNTCYRDPSVDYKTQNKRKKTPRWIAVLQRIDQEAMATAQS